MDCKSIMIMAIVCLLAQVEFSKSIDRKNRNIRSAFCPWITPKNCLVKIQNPSAGTARCNVRVNGALTNDSATRFTIVKIVTPKSGKCIEFTTRNQDKYALKVVTVNDIEFEKQLNGCHDNIAEDFIFIESRNPQTGFFTYTYNSQCLAAHRDGTLFLKNTSDASKDIQCKYRHCVY